MRDIADRLRMYFPDYETREEAADEIERLREDKLDALAAVESENAFYQMEIERLREALQRIVDIDWQFANSGTLERIEGRCAVIARAALKESE